ncbi:MAG: diaminopimelate epimerase, partial [Desulfobacula sp.]|nr:diaminopimelate epimerase [Desulfobacula sp.]
DIKFRIYNSDGSQPQMCGNGMRCFARYLYENKIVLKNKIRVDTKAGTIIPEVIVNENGVVQSIKVDMGEPVILCDEIPFKSKNKTTAKENITVKGIEYSVTAVGMGNPHCVLFVDDITKVELEKLGPLIETHERFPEKTNVEFVEVVNSKELKMKVWERGAGITLACGTGACASLVAANLAGKAGQQAIVHLDGGDLEIFWDKTTNHIFKTGTATEVFKGHCLIGMKSDK